MASAQFQVKQLKIKDLPKLFKRQHLGEQRAQVVNACIANGYDWGVKSKLKTTKYAKFENALRKVVQVSPLGIKRGSQPTSKRAHELERGGTLRLPLPTALLIVRARNSFLPPGSDLCEGQPPPPHFVSTKLTRTKSSTPNACFTRWRCRRTWFPRLPGRPPRRRSGRAGR
jgi:hypothetical protein